MLFEFTMYVSNISEQSVKLHHRGAWTCNNVTEWAKSPLKLPLTRESQRPRKTMNVHIFHTPEQNICYYSENLRHTHGLNGTCNPANCSLQTKTEARFTTWENKISWSYQTSSIRTAMRPINVRMKEFSWIYLNLLKFTWIYLNLLEFTWMYLNLLEFTWIPRFEKKTHHGPTDRRTDGPTDGQCLL